MTQAKPTPGPVYYGRYVDRVTTTKDSDGSDSICHIYGPDPRANGCLIEAAFNAAHEAAELGYDPIEAVRALPGLLRELDDLRRRCDGDEGVRADGSNIDTQQAHAVLAAARGGEPASC